MSFKNKVVIVTGSSAGIGAATAISFAKEGADVTIVGRNEARLKDVASQCAAVGKPPLVVKGDVANDDDAKKIINDTIKKFGKLDVLVNNAGFLDPGNILDGSILNVFDKTIAVNLRAAVYITVLAAPHLVKTKGNIINISSVLGQKAAPPAVSYCVSKSGLDLFTKGSALELGPFGVRVNAVSPGPVETLLRNDFISQISEPDAPKDNGYGTILNRVSEPQETADLILFVASDKSRGMTGSIILSDNGMLLK